MNHLVKSLKKILNKEMGDKEGVVISSGSGETVLATKSGVKRLPSNSIIYRVGDRVSYNDNMQAIGRKKNVLNSKTIRV